MMVVTAAGYRALAEASFRQADEAALGQVRERCLRSAAALIAMAEGSERVEAGREARAEEARRLRSL